MFENISKLSNCVRGRRIGEFTCFFTQRMQEGDRRLELLFECVSTMRSYLPTERKRPGPRATIQTMHDCLSGYNTRLRTGDLSLRSMSEVDVAFLFGRLATRAWLVRQPCAAHSWFFTNPNQLHASCVPTTIEGEPVSLATIKLSYSTTLKQFKVTSIETKIHLSRRITRN